MTYDILIITAWYRAYVQKREATLNFLRWFSDILVSKSQTPGRPGEVNFVWAGFLLQITSQMAECSKNLIGEMVMSGAGDLFLSWSDVNWGIVWLNKIDILNYCLQVVDTCDFNSMSCTSWSPVLWALFTYSDCWIFWRFGLVTSFLLLNRRTP